MFSSRHAIQLCAFREVCFLTGMQLCSVRLEGDTLSQVKCRVRLDGCGTERRNRVEHADAAVSRNVIARTKSLDNVIGLHQMREGWRSCNIRGKDRLGCSDLGPIEARALVRRWLVSWREPELNIRMKQNISMSRMMSSELKRLLYFNSATTSVGAAPMRDVPRA
jgi:hypothetical protein